MYTVGPWFVYLMNLAILAIVAIVVFIWMNVKRGQYLQESQTHIQAEIILETGHSEFYTVKCGANDEWVRIGNRRYKLNKNRRRWGLHPRLPFIGLRSIQVPIRKETWYKDDPNPAYRIRKALSSGDEEKQLLKEQDLQTAENTLTAAEVNAMVREEQAIEAAAEAIEMQHRQKELTNAIANQPNKTIVYLMLGVADLGLVILVVQRLIMGG